MIPTMNKTINLILLASLFASLPILHAGETPTPAIVVPIPTIRLSPRPQMVTGVNASVLDLGGPWQQRVNPPADFANTAVTGTAGWTEIAIPRPQPNSSARFGYQRTFRIPDDWAGKRIKFRCDSAEGLAEVWVNGQAVGKHDGSWLQFELDITTAVQSGKDNTLSIQVSPSAMGGLAGDIQGGIRRKVYLMALPTTHLAGLQVETTFDDAYRDATLTLRPEVANESATPANLALRWRMLDPAGKDVALSSNEKSLSVLPAGQSSPIEVALPVAAPLQWHPEHPNLYTLEVELRRDGKTVETVRQRIGFRQIKVQGDQLLVNGKPIKLRGAMLVYWHDSSGWGGLTDPQRRKLIGLWQDMNLNACYPNPTPDEELLDLCDEVGLAVICMARQHQTKARPELHVGQAADLVVNHRRHPSVLLWTLGNETGWSASFDAMAAAYRKLDPSRPYMMPGSNKYGRPSKEAPPEALPIDSFHYPGAGNMGKGGDRPIIHSEYAHVYGLHNAECLQDPGIRDIWYLELQPLWEAVYASQRSAGGMVFCGTDCVGITWGLVDGWHRPKPEFWHVRKIHAPVRVARQAANPAAGAPLRIEVENRYDVTDLKNLKIGWSAGGRSGLAIAEVAPRSKGMIEIPATAGISSGELTLSITNPQGRLVDTVQVALGAAPPVSPPTAKVLGKPGLARSDAAVTVTVGNLIWTFDATTGLIKSGTISGKPAITGGPFLHLGETLADWKPGKVTATETATGAVIFSEGSYGDKNQIPGSFTTTIDHSGGVSIRYEFTNAGGHKRVREIGVALDVDRACDTLTWNRRAPWTEYPADHIGRAQGTAKALRDPNGTIDDPKKEPPWSWSLDQTTAGTADFRSSKFDILEASLRSGQGTAVQVIGGPKQAVRAALKGPAIRLLVNDFAGSATSNGRYIKAGFGNAGIDPGQKITGVVNLRLADGKP